MSYDYNPGALLLAICVISSQFCLIACNHINNANHLYERPIIGNVFVGRNHSIHTNANHNKRVDKNSIVLKDRSSEPQLKLYGFASMIDPRALPTNQRNLMFANRHPLPQQNTYQHMFDGLQMTNDLQPQQSFPLPQYLDPNHPNMDEENLNLIKNYLKKYDFKRFFLKKILGDAYEKEEGHEEGFFANKHLRRHGAAGMAGKVFGELIGIKIRKTIEGFGDTISDYAKDMTENGFVAIGDTFTRLFRFG